MLALHSFGCAPAATRHPERAPPLFEASPRPSSAFVCPVDDRPLAAPDFAKAKPKSKPTLPPPSDKTRVVVIREMGTDIRGQLPPEIIKRILRSNFPRIRACYEQSLTHKGRQIRGTVSTEFEIGADGLPAWANTESPESTFPDDKMRACVAHVFGCLRFPAPEQGLVHVRYPLQFEAWGAVRFEDGYLVFDGKVGFQPGTAEISGSGSDLDDIAEMMNTTGKSIDLLEISAHMDKGKDEKSALEMSQARAQAVVDALVARGVDAKRLLAKGYGAYCTSYGKAHPANERVKLTIVKWDGKLTGFERGCAAAREEGVRPAPIP